MVPIKCNVIDILQNMFFCVQQKKEMTLCIPILHHILAIRHIYQQRNKLKASDWIYSFLLISLNKRDLQVTSTDMPDLYLVSELFSKLCEVLLHCIFMLR